MAIEAAEKWIKNPTKENAAAADAAAADAECCNICRKELVQPWSEED